MSQMGDSQLNQASQQGLGSTGYQWNGVFNPYQQYSREGNSANWAIQGLLAQGLQPSDITPNLIAQALPSYEGTDPHKADVASGDAWVANYVNQKNAPTGLQLQQQQQQQFQQAYSKDQGKWDSQTSQVFQSLLGRAPSADEASHFGVLLASGQTDPYQIQQYLSQTPEYLNAQNQKYQQNLAQQMQSNYSSWFDTLNKQNQTFQTNLSGQLNDISGQFFNQYVQPSVTSQFASQGRDVSGASTGLQFALANAAKEMATQNQQYVAGVSSQQFGQAQQQAQQSGQYLGNVSQQQYDKALSPALQTYQSQLDQQMGMQNASFGNAISNQNALMNQGWQSANYGRQSNDLMNYLNASRPSSNPMASTFSGALSGGLAAYGKTGNPWAAAGGAAAGGLFGYGAGGGF